MSDADSMTPRSLLNSDGNYVAQHQAMYDLLKYIQVGGSLPTDLGAYESRLNLNPVILFTMQSVLEPLVEAYAEVKSDSNECKNNIYPLILRTADLTLMYARNAAGISGVSPYTDIFQCVRDLAAATNHEDILRLNEEIDMFIRAEMELLQRLQTQSSQCVDHLRGLEGRMMQSQNLVKQRGDAVHTLASQLFPNSTAIEATVLQLRVQLMQIIAPYEHEQLVACMPPSYSWLDLFGILAMSAIAHVSGSEAIYMAGILEAVSVALVLSNVVVADLIAIDTDLSNVLAQTGVAINVVEQMMSGWAAISDDLGNLLTMVKTDILVANQYIASLNEKKIISKWKDLAEAVARYQGATQNDFRSSTIPSTSMADLARQLRAQAGQEDGVGH
ncbi:hypothetical protein FB107DRAFT_275621 [Schizophyllum commune]